MAKVLLKVFLSFIASIVGIILAPIDLLIANAFPDLATMISNFNSSLNQLLNYISTIIGFILNLLPSPTRTALYFYLVVLLATYTITISIHLIIKVIRIIQNIKFW